MTVFAIIAISLIDGEFYAAVCKAKTRGNLYGLKEYARYWCQALQMRISIVCKWLVHRTLQLYLGGLPSTASQPDIALEHACSQAYKHPSTSRQACARHSKGWHMQYKHDRAERKAKHGHGAHRGSEGKKLWCMLLVVGSWLRRLCRSGLSTDTARPKSHMSATKPPES